MPGDQVTRRSRTGIIIYVNKAPIIWYSKRQNTVETITYGSEMVAEERSATKAKYMKEIYPNAVEDKPTNAPSPKVKRVQITCFVDADHGGDQVTGRSRTGILVYVNKATIIWYNRRHTTAEKSTYGSEMVAMRLAVEMIKALKYK